MAETVWDFLGIEPRRKPEKTVQLVKHFEEVNKKVDEGVLHKKVSFPMYVQEKKDGVFCFVVVKASGETKLFNRTGKALTNVQHLADHFESILGTGIYLTELTNDVWSLEVLSGVVNPNRVEPLVNQLSEECQYMTLNFHDHLTIQEFVLGESSRTYLERYHRIFVTGVDESDILEITKVDTLQQIQALSKFYISGGCEGIVIKQDVGWVAGAKDWHQMKIVRRISYDLECIGWEEGTGKYEGLVANLIFRWKDGKTIKAMLGKGWTHADAEYMFNIVNYGANVGLPEYTHVDSPVGKVFKVYALQESSKGVLRLPKVGELRIDKDTADY